MIERGEITPAQRKWYRSSEPRRDGIARGAYMEMYGWRCPDVKPPAQALLGGLVEAGMIASIELAVIAIGLSRQ
jgi:hypothetical protein